MVVQFFPRALATLTLAACLVAGSRAQPAQPPAPADNCDGIRQQIEARFRAGGVPNPALAVLPQAGASGGRVVGNCANGSRVIVHTGSAGNTAGGTTGSTTGSTTAGALPPRPAAEPAAERATDKIPTECKDGSIVIGPRCDDPRAVRMTSAELAGSAPQPPARPASQ